jgi:hypothetical protein
MFTVRDRSNVEFASIPCLDEKIFEKTKNESIGLTVEQKNRLENGLTENSEKTDQSNEHDQQTISTSTQCQTNRSIEGEERREKEMFLTSNIAFGHWTEPWKCQQEERVNKRNETVAKDRS